MEVRNKIETSSLTHIYVREQEEEEEEEEEEEGDKYGMFNKRE